MTLEEFTIQELRNFPKATGQLSGLLRDISLAAKRINVEVNKAGLVHHIIGSTGTTNIQGEEVQKLDEFANAQLINVLRGGINCAGIASEETDDIMPFDDPMSNKAKYVVLFDPLDGSSNIDVNISIGSIFCIMRRVTPLGTPCTEEDFLQDGKAIVAAGYIIYGSSTMMVYATRRGVNGFTLDPSIGEFTLSHPNISQPASGTIYSVNYGNFGSFSGQVQQFIENCQNRHKNNGGPYSLRYTGSLVADIHRNMLKGGIFLYPTTSKAPNGKLRLLYECMPMAFIVERAGGKASNGSKRILDIKATSLHQRSALIIGSEEMMIEYHNEQRVDTSRHLVY
ncbi:D-fructose 1,6-bisphosphatase [Filimonas lacunae]|uniref:Fructose-1,6-bisphosphatase class 1 n=2 Tax=Filimonas lacunae TaxID=477680 RepID=A0A173MAR3_9BACT|nr:fructose-1,6-bisphosphatase, type I [Filimonas lacunae]SIT32616.1 D-fructose 1,6-bisphosphatase [Filimonas lacunae]